jgi:integrase/recombinase XerD
MLRDRCQAAKLPQFAPHAFRHGCGVHIVQRGGDISLVQKILGHQQLATTTVYLRFDSDQLRGLYDRIFD